MLENIQTITEISKSLNITVLTIVIIIILAFCIIYVEKIFLLKGAICGLFARLFTVAKKGQLSNQLRGVVLKTIKHTELSAGELIPNNLRIEWVNNEKQETFINKQQIIIRIKQNSNPNDNLISIVSEYVNCGLLYDIKQYINKDVMSASQLLITRKIIQNANKAALPYMDEHFTIPKLNENNILKENYEKLHAIDNNGMFIGILLNEFHKAGMSIYGEIQDPELLAESSEFMRYLYCIAKGISDDPERLCFNRDYFKVSIFLTASDKTLKHSGITPFLKAIHRQLNEGIETIYIFGLGSKREVATLISEETKQDIRISKIIKHSYKHISNSGKRINGVFYECSIYKDNKLDTL